MTRSRAGGLDYDPEEDESYQRYARLYAAGGAAAMEEHAGQGGGPDRRVCLQLRPERGAAGVQRLFAGAGSAGAGVAQAALAEYQQEGKALQNQYSMLDAQEKGGL